MRRFRVVTKHQVSGWRFLLRRIEHALVRRDTSMRDDPGRGRSTALTIGVALACVIIAGAAVLAFFKPAKTVGNSRIVADKETGALYVRVGERLHPALNLTSARLIIGAADKPVQVSRAELEKYPRGPWVGIPGAPGSMVDTDNRESTWTVCDSTQTGAAAPVNPETGLPSSTRSALRTTVIGGPLTLDSGAARELDVGEARLLRDGTTNWLVYRDGARGVVRGEINLADTAVLLALGIDATAPVLAASKGLIGAIPEVPPIRVPQVDGAGETVTLTTGYTVPVGSVLAVHDAERPSGHYLVSKTGVVQISSVLAAMIRNSDAHGTVTSRNVGPDLIAANLRPGGWPGTAAYPTRPIELVNPSSSGVTCYRWSRSGSDQTAATTLLVGRRLPLTQEEQVRVVNLVTAPASRGKTADSAYLPRTTGRLVQVTGTDTASPLRESLYWIADNGVRYGIEITDRGAEQTLRALGLRAPVAAPWSVVSLFAPGPSLSEGAARIQHDGIAPNTTGVGLGGPA
ncbi:type VII secretion protein EccB [Nocardia iowensis]|uniref:Type VII secretion protein EccB n=1 Tax=Nocardia iowensis TaxID=204891 RepID=A0ABX8RZU3_NOCIO|nr:type VII secretion protein EccB [Nocardia iowensis]QXN94671.1 type VII secretion protein EccB [Nocardia iowensis]